MKVSLRLKLWRWRWRWSAFPYNPSTLSENVLLLVLHIYFYPWRSIFVQIVQTWRFGMLCKQLKIQIGVNCVQSVCQCCVCWGKNFQTIAKIGLGLVRYLSTNSAFVIQVSNHRDKRPFDLSFGQPMTGWHINDNGWRQRYLPYSATLFRFSIFSILKANQRSMFSLEVRKRARTVFYRYTLNNSHPNVVFVTDSLTNMQLQPITTRGGACLICCKEGWSKFVLSHQRNIMKQVFLSNLFLRLC